ncbi:response regulator [Paenibacillus abyssi]|uniref:DNA-binding response regulator n=1 Tax=Paenibacillus abyssi TaxID=1340531 RepID=A0A917CQJ8_9BACL|nr:response regulator [Paenibacillus abyssi]GGF96206.1 DNA-binding response regulator [Paenibacillus abyssi]
MKVLIIDDEEDVRESIRLIIPWKDYQIDTIFEAADGISAQEIIQNEKPEIIFTDIIMPGKNGLELLEWIQQYAPKSKTIVISGHDDYQYVRHTLQHGGMDYILKPIDRHEIIKSLQQALSDWTKDESHRQQLLERNKEMNHIKPFYWDKLFSSLITNPEWNQQTLRELDKEFNLQSADTCQIAVLSMHSLHEKIIRKFGNNVDLLYFALTNIGNEVLGQTKEGYMFRHVNKDQEIVLLIWKNHKQFINKIRKMNETFKQLLHASFHFGVGEIQSFSEGLADTYKQAKRALRQSNYLEEQSYIHEFTETESLKSHKLFFADYAKSITIAIKSNELEQINQAVDQWIEAVKELRVITLDQLEYWRHEYHLMKTYLLKEMFPDEDEHQLSSKNLFFPLNSDGMFSITLWREELISNCAQFAAILVQTQKKENSVIHEIKKYIDDHYNEDLMLQTLADQFFISREYVSRKFKQEFGQNVSDYIESKRVENARILLLNDTFSISEIAASAGYQDARYFSKVFAKVVGVSPMKYRKKMRNEG